MAHQIKIYKFCEYLSKNKPIEEINFKDYWKNMNKFKFKKKLILKVLKLPLLYIHFNLGT